MNGKKERIKGILTDIVVLTVMMATALLIIPYSVYAEGDIDVKNSDGLVLEIVDDAETLIDESVPLAAGPIDNNFVSHAVLGGVLLALCLIYIIYFGRYQKKIFALRKEVAEAESRVMRS